MQKDFINFFVPIQIKLSFFKNGNVSLPNYQDRGKVVSVDEQGQGIQKV